jgi:hypothetical protein
MVREEEKIPYDVQNSMTRFHSTHNISQLQIIYKALPDYSYRFLETPPEPFQTLQTRHSRSVILLVKCLKFLQLHRMYCVFSIVTMTAIFIPKGLYSYYRNLAFLYLQAYHSIFAIPAPLQISSFSFLAS